MDLLEGEYGNCGESGQEIKMKKFGRWHWVGKDRLSYRYYRSDKKMIYDCGLYIGKVYSLPVDWPIYNELDLEPGQQVRIRIEIDQRK